MSHGGCVKYGGCFLGCGLVVCVGAYRDSFDGGKRIDGAGVGWLPQSGCRIVIDRCENIKREKWVLLSFWGIGYPQREKRRGHVYV